MINTLPEKAPKNPICEIGLRGKMYCSVADAKSFFVRYRVAHCDAGIPMITFIIGVQPEGVILIVFRIHSHSVWLHYTLLWFKIVSFCRFLPHYLKLQRQM